MATVRRPAVAGQFYPVDPQALQEMISGFLGGVKGNGEAPRAIIAPHAGYIYSGPIAASAYAHLVPLRDKIRRVVLLGPAHRVPVQGLAASSADAFATPLGNVPLDQGVIRSLLSLPQVHLFDQAHQPEHGLEVHLPFIQTILKDFVLVPLVVGDTSPSDVAQVLERFAGDANNLIIVSSDLSHYQPYESAYRLDRETTRAIEGLRPLTAGQACGRYAINGLLHLARQHDWHVRTVDLRNSGDTAGPRHQVVGYGAYLFYS